MNVPVNRFICFSEYFWLMPVDALCFQNREETFCHTLPQQFPLLTLTVLCRTIEFAWNAPEKCIKSLSCCGVLCSEHLMVYFALTSVAGLPEVKTGE